jgi:hypothetical protein
MNNPQVMIKVGNAGDVGNIEIQDVLFTVKGATQGAVLVEWNAKAASQGSVAIWGKYNFYFPDRSLIYILLQTPTSELAVHLERISRPLIAQLDRTTQTALQLPSPYTLHLELTGILRTCGLGQQITTWTLELLRHKSISSAEEVSIFPKHHVTLS